MKTRTVDRRRKVLRAIGIVVVVLILIRLILPTIVLRYVNKTLASMDGYFDHVEDVDLSLYRGAYKIKKIYINKVEKAGQQVPFVSADLVDLSVEWKALLKGSIAGEAVVTRPSLIFTLNKVEPSQVQNDSSDFKKVLKDLMPLKVNRFQIIEGQIGYKDLTTTPNVNIGLNHLSLVAENLRNSYKTGELLPADIVASAHAYGGRFKFEMKINPLASSATFDLNSSLENTQLPQLNNFIKAYSGIDVHRGTFGVYAELAAKKGRYKGYLKPVIKDLDVVGPEDKKDGLFNRLWENVAAAAGKVLRNQKKNQIATRLPLEGSTQNLKTSTWYAILEVLRNAFLEALSSSIENKITIHSIEQEPEKKPGFFKRLFGAGNDKKKEKNKSGK